MSSWGIEAISEKWGTAPLRDCRTWISSFAMTIKCYSDFEFIYCLIFCHLIIGYFYYSSLGFLTKARTFDNIVKDILEREDRWLIEPLIIHASTPRRLAFTFSSLASPPRSITIGVTPGGLSNPFPRYSIVPSNNVFINWFIYRLQTLGRWFSQGFLFAPVLYFFWRG